MDEVESALLVLATVSGLSVPLRENTVARLLQPASRDSVLQALADGAVDSLPGWDSAGSIAVQELRSGAARKRTTVIAERCRLAGISLLFRGGDGYPLRLLDLEAAPPVLYFRGSPAVLNDGPGWVAMVGSRRSTELGLRFARRSARELAAAGLTVVSGLALGTDAAVHQGALDAEGRTVAVLASGVDEFTPRSNSALGRRIIERGAVLSENPPGTRVQPWSFPDRNRIIAALAATVVILEAGVSSGTTLTAEAALELERTVFVMPGRPGDSATAGGLELLSRQDVRIFRSSADVLAFTPGAALQPQLTGPGADLMELAGLMAEHLPCRIDQLPDLLGLDRQLPVLLGSINLLKMHGVLHEDAAGNLNLVAGLPGRS